MMLRTHDFALLSSALLSLSLGLTGCDGGEGTTDTDGTSSSSSTSSQTTGETDGQTSTDSSSGTTSASGTTVSPTSSTSGTSGNESSTGESSGTESTSGGETTGGETGHEATGGGASLPDGFEDTLSGSGCADMTVWGRNDDDSIALVLWINDDLVADTAASGTTYEGTHSFDEFESFSVLVGTQVSFPVCNDVAIDETVIDQEWVATAGSVEITIEPVEDAPQFSTQGYATVELSGVEVSFGDATEALEDITFENVAVGWLPG